jgi:hypothetical protein
MTSPLFQKYAFGQGLSVILATTGLINGWLVEKQGLNIPALQAALTYTLILVGSIFYISLMGRGDREASPIEEGELKEMNKDSSMFCLLRKHSKILFGAVLFDVAANWLVVKAFSELKLPEVMVFSGLSTPATLLMAFMWSPTRPKFASIQLVGMGVALSAIVFYSVLTIRGEFTGSAVGISCAVFSAFAYAASNHFQERVAHVMAPVEFLLGLGLLGSLLAWMGVAFSFQEIGMFIEVCSGGGGGHWWSVVGVVLLYGIVLSSFYLLIPVYMSRHSAVSFNFSLLTANFLGILGSWMLLQAEYSKWLYATVIFVNFGLLLYYFGEEA